MIHIHEVRGSNPLEPIAQNLGGQVAKAAGSSPASSILEIIFNFVTAIAASRLSRRKVGMPILHRHLLKLIMVAGKFEF